MNSFCFQEKGSSLYFYPGSSVKVDLKWSNLALSHNIAIYGFQEKGSFSIFLPWMEAGRTNIELQSASRFSFPTFQIPRLKFWIIWIKSLKFWIWIKKPQILNTNKNLKFWIYEYKLWTKENDICTLISILALPHIVDTSIGARAHQDHILVSGFVLSWGGNKFNW